MELGKIKLGDKNFLIIDLKEHVTTGSLNDPICFKEIIKRLGSMPDINGIIFKKSYKRIFDEDAVKILREYIDALKKIPKQNLCDEDFEKFSIFKFKSEENAISALNYLKKIKPCRKDKKYFDDLKEIFKKIKLWELVEKYKNKREAEIYHLIFKERIVPGFISYYTEKIDENVKILESYEIDGSKVIIYEKPGKPFPIYYLKPKELNLGIKKLVVLSEAFEKLSEEEFDPKIAEKICAKVLNEFELSDEEKKELVSILKRYSFGYGVVEILLKDPKLQDIFIDSPGDKPIYVYHEDYEECRTNIILTSEELEKLSTRFRMLSGRPFDESYPVLHAELKDLNVRIAGITEPMTFSGIGFAFRKHSIRPWTLTQFIKNKMITPEAAGLISFLVDGQKSILITGPRGSGKTSFLGAILAEIPQKYRIIVIEDTPELPVEKLRDLGFNIQHIRIKSTLQREAYEVSAEEALRSALRLGESVLVIGEVRGEEAKSLFEAMRIGAAGNVVLGTIHGSSPYDVWDRIVNDLNVPSTSFKATDFIISCAPIRKHEELKRYRRVVGITEVLKYWREDPHAENGFFDLMIYDRKKDSLKFGDLRKSEAIKEIILKRGIDFKDAIASIMTRGKIKELIAKASERNENLLGIEFTVASVNKYIELIKSEISYCKLLSEFKKWLKKQQKEFKCKKI